MWSSSASSSSESSSLSRGESSSESSEEETERPLELPVGTIVRNKWRVGKKLGEGGCGVVYEVANVDSKGQPRTAALKVEPAQQHAEDEILKMEAHVMSRLRQSRHICKVFMSGKVSDRMLRFNFIAITLLGRNLADLRRKAPGQKFSRRTAISVCSSGSNLVVCTVLLSMPAPPFSSCDRSIPEEFGQRFPVYPQISVQSFGSIDNES